MSEIEYSNFIDTENTDSFANNNQEFISNPLNNLVNTAETVADIFTEDENITVLENIVNHVTSNKDINHVVNDEVINNEEIITDDTLQSDDSKKQNILVRLPLSRIKSIVKTDPEVTLASADAILLITKSTEMFIHILSQQAYEYTMQAKRKTVQMKDIDLAINKMDCFAFLEGIFEI